jgi:hypothetical protein
MKHRQSSAIPHRTKGIVRFMRRMRGVRLWAPGPSENVNSWSKVENYNDPSQEELQLNEPKITYRDLWPYY